MFSRKFKNFLIWVLLLGLVISTATLFIKLDRQTTQTSFGSEIYEVGSLTSTGALKESNTAIRSKKAMAVDGLTIEVKENSNVNYTLYFFDEEGELVGTPTTATAENFASSSIPESATTFMIVISQVASDDYVVQTINPLNISTLAKQVVITVSK